MRTLFCLSIATFILILAPFVMAQKVVFQDDFSKDLSQWKVLVEDTVNGTKWTVHDGFLDSGNGDSNPEPLAVMAGDASWADIVLEADGTVTAAGQGTGYFQFMARMKDTQNWYALRYITGDPASLATEGVGGLKTANPEVWLVKRVGGKYAMLAQEGTAKAVPNVSNSGTDLKGVFIKFKFEVVGDTLKGSIDSGKGYELFVQAKDSDLKNGAIGLGQQEYAASFDNVKVTQIVSAPGVAVEPQNKLATLWGKIKSQ
jgi:hypothetical protein